MWIDFNRPHEAAAYFDVAELAAREADCPDLAAWTMATRSIGPFFAGDPTTAHTLLRRAERHAVSSEVSPRRRAWVSALLARAAAAAGRHDEAHRALDTAHHQIDLVTEPGSGTDFFDAARLHGVAGSALLAMRDTTRAAPVLRDALDRRAARDSKGRALLTLDLAECLVHDGEVEEASRVAVESLDMATGSMVEPITARARAVHAHLRRSAGSMGGDLEARLREHGVG